MAINGAQSRQYLCPPILEPFGGDALLALPLTARGAALGMLAGFLILPAGTRDAFGVALDAVVDAAYAVLDAAVDRILGRPVAVAPVELARDLVHLGREVEHLLCDGECDAARRPTASTARPPAPAATAPPSLRRRS